MPLDARLQLPQGKFSYLLQDWDQFLVVEEPYGGVSDRLNRILGFSQSVDSLERMNRKSAALVPDFFDALPAPAPEQEGEIVVASADGKGVPMRRLVEEAPIEGHRPKRGPKPNTKKMALLGTVYTVDPLPRTPQDVVASLFRGPRVPRGRPVTPDSNHPPNPAAPNVASTARVASGKTTRRPVTILSNFFGANTVSGQ